MLLESCIHRTYIRIPQDIYSVLLTTLGNANQHAIIAAYIPKHTGCSTQVPAA